MIILKQSAQVMSVCLGLGMGYVNELDWWKKKIPSNILACFKQRYILT